LDGFERRRERKKESIRRAALELFKINGIKKVSIAEIAKKAHVSPVTIYNHFGDKNTLTCDVIKQSLMEK
jgi:AcrR family transcriptional regulator